MNDMSIRPTPSRDRAVLGRPLLEPQLRDPWRLASAKTPGRRDALGHLVAGQHDEVGAGVVEAVMDRRTPGARARSHGRDDGNAASPNSEPSQLDGLLFADHARVPP